MRKRPYHPAGWSLLLRGLLLATLICALVPRPAAAQVLYGSVIGTITDQSDAVVPDSTVTLTSKDTGLANRWIHAIARSQREALAGKCKDAGLEIAVP